MIGDAIASLLGKVIDRAWPDPAAKAQAAQALAELQQAGEFKVLDAELDAMRMQASVNQVEAAHSSVFVAGWRPAIGWVCAGSLAWHFIGRPVATAISGAAIPEIDLGDLITITGGMLGLATLRGMDKWRGVAAVIPSK